MAGIAILNTHTVHIVAFLKSHIFTARCTYRGITIVYVVCPSACLSVRPSVRL